MRLAQYLAENNLNYSQFGRRVGRSAATVSRMARGLQRPDWDTMVAIRTATGGAVTPNDFAPRDPNLGGEDGTGGEASP